MLLLSLSLLMTAAFLLGFPVGLWLIHDVPQAVGWVIIGSILAMPVFGMIFGRLLRLRLERGPGLQRSALMLGLCIIIPAVAGTSFVGSAIMVKQSPIANSAWAIELILFVAGLAIYMVRRPPFPRPRSRRSISMC